MAAPRQLLFAGIDLSRTFFNDLLTEDTKKKIVETRKILDDNKSVEVQLNPGDAKPILFSWGHDKISADLKDIFVTSTVFDQTYAEGHENAVQNLSATLNKLPPNYSVVKLELDLKDKLLVTHVKMETKEVQYHRDPHPNESQRLASRIEIKNEKGDTITNAEDQARAASAFAIHDGEYSFPQAGRNEIESAILLYDAKMKAYTKLYDDISRDGTLDEKDKASALQAINDYKNTLAYEAWKTVVAATTMCKQVPGNPTIYLAQKLGVEKLLQITPRMLSTALDRQAMIMSMIDSNFAAFQKQLQNDRDMILPSSLVAHIPEKVKAILFNPPGEKNLETLTEQGKNSIDIAGLLYGQNERMFPEMHAAYKAALFKSQFIVPGENPKNGVELWNEAIEAARVYDDKLNRLLSLGITQQIDIPAFSPNSPAPPPIGKDSTLQDIFIHRIGSEIMFAREQGLKLYIALAEKLGVDAPDIQYNAWNEHADRLEALRDRYNDPNNKEHRLEIAKALFHITAHQPGVFLDSEKRLANIEAEKKNLLNLPEEQKKLQSELDVLTEQRNTLIDSITNDTLLKLNAAVDKNNTLKEAPDKKPPTGTSRTASIQSRLFEGLLKSAVNPNKVMENLKDQLSNVESKITRVKEELNDVTKQLENREKSLRNLTRTANELNAVIKTKVADLSMKASEEKPAPITPRM